MGLAIAKFKCLIENQTRRFLLWSLTANNDVINDFVTTAIKCYKDEKAWLKA